VTQLAGPFALIKVKTVEKTMNGIRAAGARGLRGGFVQKLPDP